MMKILGKILHIGNDNMIEEIPFVIENIEEDKIKLLAISVKLIYDNGINKLINFEDKSNIEVDGTKYVSELSEGEEMITDFVQITNIK